MKRGSGSSPGSGGKGAGEMGAGGSQTSQSLRASLCPQRAVEETTGCRFHKYISGGSTEFRRDGTRQERGEKLGDLFSSSGDRCSYLSSCSCSSEGRKAKLEGDGDEIGRASCRERV